MNLQQVTPEERDKCRQSSLQTPSQLTKWYHGETCDMEDKTIKCFDVDFVNREISITHHIDR